MNISELVRVSEFEWAIPVGLRPGMQVPVRLFATRQLLDQVKDDKSLEQAANAATLPGLVGSVIVMPDMHQGYGFPIGGVAATSFPHGVISPGAIGYDINCGVRLLASSLEVASIGGEIEALASRLYAYCPSGVGKAGAISLTSTDLEQVLRDGSLWAIRNGYGSESDLLMTEQNGREHGARIDKVSGRAKARGRDQLGSLGSGNHFIEVDVVDQVFDARVAAVFGLRAGCVTVQIHCGSRGLGHQVCTDYVQQFQIASKKYGIRLADRELVCAPLDSPDGEAYLGAMRSAANFAFCNRQLLAHKVRQAFEDTFGARGDGWQVSQVYDVAHNIGRIESHEVGGVRQQVCVHRKGATRAFGPGAAGLPSRYLATGQPVLVPGSMGSASWILAGTRESMRLSFGSSCHGAGRRWSRTRAKSEVRGDALLRELEQQGIRVRAGSLRGLAEEAPAAYKDVDSVIDTVVAVGIVRKVARLKPIIVIKG